MRWQFLLRQLDLFLFKRALNELVHLVAEEHLMELAGFFPIDHLLQAGQVLRTVMLVNELLVRKGGNFVI